ncbi:type I-U CRISPR-associated RAMP protein Csb1/Cas7u [Pendulispora albinea]|uniref:Type I-U CRISPR-associated RAMP protein Csb1/Cas7u n=1 Tax=Pendulispora albinea TaxID=2741071 RepID=A0ABZ2M4B3_9BACT
MNLSDLLAGPYAAIRLTQRLQSSAGDGSKVFPPTFEGGVYCLEQRRIGGISVPCVILDSVPSSANRQEEVLGALVEAGKIEIPHFRTEFSEFPELGEVTTLNAPHRVFDAIFRDSELDGKPFPKHPLYAELCRSNTQNATALFAHGPSALVFGTWDSTGSAGGLGNKFARNMVTEIIGVHVERGETRGGVRQDPLGISRHVEIEIDKSGDWRPKGVATKKDDRAKGTRPSEVNHGNILVSVAYEGAGAERRSLKGGVTCDYALQLSVITLAGLRRLRFPLAGRRDPAVDEAARAVLVALGLVALTSTRERGYALRSRCDLVADGTSSFEIVGQDGTVTTEALDSKGAIALYHEAVTRAKKAGLPWDPAPKVMKPHANLSKLISLSRQAGAE